MNILATGGPGSSADDGPPGTGGPEVVRAGGGAVWRRVPWGSEVVIVHRPAYDDWSLPKGKAHPTETDEQAALREVLEETGLECRLGPPLPSTTYRDADGRLKVVHYWAMSALPGQAPAGAVLEPAQAGLDEVDELRWALLPEARKLLTYPRDVLVLDALEQLLASKAPAEGR